jgi:predicted amidohydrolase YtcJ
MSLTPTDSSGKHDQHSGRIRDNARIEPQDTYIIPDPAGILLCNGRVFAGTGRPPITADVAIRDGRIAAIGSGVTIPGAEVVDLRGRLLIPGFQDAHVHPVQGGLTRRRCDLLQVSGSRAVVATVAAYAHAHPELAWVTGGGWSMADFPGGTPRREALDEVIEDRPVLLHNRDTHGAWANTRALRMAGITDSTTDPPDGRIERDPDGTPSGTLHEGAVDLVSRLIPLSSEAENIEALLDAQSYLHELGITAWQDAIVGSFGMMGDPSSAYHRLGVQGRLTGRVVGALWWDRERGLEQIPELLERRAELAAGRFAATSVKIMQDGVAENLTAAMTSPYTGCDHAGLSFVDPELLCRAVTRLDAEGFQVHFHAIGDRAVREALDAVAAARSANGPSDNRHHVAHVQVVHPDDLPRFGALGVTATIQPLWAAYEPQMTELTLPVLGPQRSAWQYPFADLLRSTGLLAAGSDWPVSSADPWEGIHVAVNRSLPPQDAYHDPRPFLPGQRLSLADALTAYTAGSAYANHLDDTGTIAVGKLADLVVLDRDPFAGDPAAIAQTRVVATYVGGVPVYTR